MYFSVQQTYTNWYVVNFAIVNMHLLYRSVTCLHKNLD